VQTGDRIRLDVPARSLELLIAADELAARLAARDGPSDTPQRGYARLFDRHVLQADEGLDFDFLKAGGDG
jgi:dihydroxy-acid dehydratase